MVKKYQTILFDMDGTLCDSDKMLGDALGFLYDKYRGGYRPPREKMIYFSGPPIKDTLRNEFPNVDINVIFEEFKVVSASFYETGVFAYPHSREVLEKLIKDGFKLGIVTNKTHNLTLLALHVIGLEDLFDVLICFDDVSKGKPDKEGIMKAISLLNGEKKSSLYLGDNASDLETANNAGIDCCLVNWGPRVLDPALKPAFKINSYLDLEEHLYE